MTFCRKCYASYVAGSHLTLQHLQGHLRLRGGARIHSFASGALALDSIGDRAHQAPFNPARLRFFFY